MVKGEDAFVEGEVNLGLSKVCWRGICRSSNEDAFVKGELEISWQGCSEDAFGEHDGIWWCRGGNTEFAHILVYVCFFFLLFTVLMNE